MDEAAKRALFLEFNEEVYRSVLDDTAHFIKEHGDDIERVHGEWTELYGLPKCTVSECAQTERHYGRGRRDRKRESVGEEEDALYAFYESLYDRVHHFIFHLFEVGLRVDASSLSVGGGGGDEKEPESEGVAVDKLFAAERDRIRSRRKECKVDLDRLDDANNKFTIQSAKGTEGGLTLMDALVRGVAENENVGKEALRRMMAYFVQNGYDSDGVEADLEDATDSNIYGLVQDELAVQWMSTFIRTKKCMLSLSLSVVSSLSLNAHSNTITLPLSLHSLSESVCIFNRIHLQLLGRETRAYGL